MSLPIVSVQISFQLTEEMVDQILVTAFDGNYGGSLYWAEVKELKHFPFTDGEQRWKQILLQDKEDGHLHYVDGERLAPAIKKYIEDDCIRDSCLAETINSEATDFDAGEADHIIQLAIFEEVRYG